MQDHGVLQSRSTNQVDLFDPEVITILTRPILIVTMNKINV